MRGKLLLRPTKLARPSLAIPARTMATHSLTARVEPAPPPASAEATPVRAPPACSDDMVLVDGRYCTAVKHVCKRWLDDQKLPYARCGQYEPRAACVGERVPLRFCIDRHEYTAPGDERPKNYGSFVTATKICKSLGKRVCTEREWNFACEGEEMRPYPYGWEREPKCNQDQAELYERSAKKVYLKDLRATANAYPECVSPFGVRDMVGNMTHGGKIVHERLTAS